MQELKVFSADCITTQLHTIISRRRLPKTQTWGTVMHDRGLS